MKSLPLKVQTMLTANALINLSHDKRIPEVLRTLILDHGRDLCASLIEFGKDYELTNNKS